VKRIWIVQVPAPPAIELPQLLVWVKSPLELMLLMLSAALPMLVRVTLIGDVGLRSGSLPKLTCCGESATEGRSFGPILARKPVVLALTP